MAERIVLSSDHAAIPLRLAIAAHVAARGWEAVDIGPTTPQSTPYPQHGEAAARLVASGDCRLGIVLCGTGQGIMMAANKVKGVRCAYVWNSQTAQLGRKHNDANVIAFGQRMISEYIMLECVQIFLSTEFEGGRHVERIKEIEAP